MVIFILSFFFRIPLIPCIAINSFLPIDRHRPSPHPHPPPLAPSPVDRLNEGWNSFPFEAKVKTNSPTHPMHAAQSGHLVDRRIPDPSTRRPGQADLVHAQHLRSASSIALRQVLSRVQLHIHWRSPGIKCRAAHLDSSQICECSAKVSDKR
ncbi:hypothetical protein BO94DRAFT_393376 [Aspergillus sclerotioniger CBS 115572]|uniref:Uncharacterized protein n=1 Tax=Aspergillus sclerotioniger CBS 115572 TaxID=1450535 RepID=A0A317WYF0_9EURO|nr:hypothetical protein BO94DRAFT_393376 [Aspergillus sclerotioniger CBS 115572]PWY91436.1 hypothetical protein BO94DRAFT_393376 [Aspergillus sclerotioniger CBS 115572]